MAITQEQQSIIIKAHAEGHLDPAIARLAGISIATVKRYRTKLGLETNCVTAKRGKLGEQLTFTEAEQRGLDAEWRKGHNDEFDLYVQGQRVDAKASMQLANGSWRFRLPTKRPSFYGQYEYAKDYAADCEVVVLVALYPDERKPDYYLLDSKSLPSDVRIRPGGAYDAIKNCWSLLEASAPAFAA